MQKETCSRFKKLSCIIRKKIDHLEFRQQYPELTNVMCWTIGFLYRNSINNEVYQKDIENEFKINKSTATELLQTMSELGYITREVSDYDGRLKKIFLTEKALNVHKEIQNGIKNIEEKATKNLSSDDMKILHQYLDQIEANLMEEGND